MILAPPPPDVVQAQPAATAPASAAATAATAAKLFPLQALPAGDEPEEPAPEPDRRMITPPTWVRPPSLAEARAAYPAAAAADGVGGLARFVCRIEPDTSLSRCYVAGDGAGDGYGFGKAAMALAPLLRIRQKTVDGVPVTNGRVIISFRFEPPEGARPPRALWTASPTSAEVQAALPRPSGRPVTTGGRGVMRCTASGGLLSDCRPAADRAGPFDRAAVKLGPSFTLEKAFANGRPTEGAIFDIPVMFDAPGAKPPAAVLDNPVRFIHAPSNGQKNAVFPQAARDHGVTTLSVSEACVVAPDGSLIRCRATKEDPTGVGGAEAATRLVNAFQLPTWSAEGRPVAGAAATIDIVWAPLATPQAAAGPAAAGTIAKPTSRPR